MLSPLQAPQIHVLFYEGSGSFGNGCVAFDTAESAAIMSKAVGAPVRLQMMRWDEHGWTHYAPAIMYDMRAGIDSSGNIVAYEATGFGQGGTSIYTGRELLGAGPGSPNATANALPSKVAGSGAVTENLSPWMKVSSTNYKVINKPIDSTMGIFHSGPLRAPGAQQTTLADAQTMHALAVAANMDDLAFRLQNMNTDLDGSRWSAVLQAAASAAGWKPWVPGSKVSKDNVVTGRGIANSHHGGAYAAAVADIQVNKKTGKITVTHMYASQDSGFSMNPSLIYNQMIGNVIQGTSRAMSEEVTFNKNQVTSIDWIGYPILRFKDSPNVTVVLVQRTDQPSLGLGRAAHVPDHRRDRERVLRCDRRAPARGAVHARPRSCDAEGRGRRLGRRAAPDCNEHQGPGRSGPLVVKATESYAANVFLSHVAKVTIASSRCIAQTSG